MMHASEARPHPGCDVAPASAYNLVLCSPIEPIVELAILLRAISIFPLLPAMANNLRLAVINITVQTYCR